jgi:hypothetical protein
MTRLPLDSGLKQALSQGTPVEVFDPATNEVYYVVSADQFHGLSAVTAGDFDPRDGYPLIEQVMADDDAHDPLLDSYQ